MPEEPGVATDSPLLRGLFGVFQAGAAQGKNTSDIWSDLRSSAATWQFQAQGVQQPYDPAALQDAGREILRAQGIGATTVSTFRGVAGQWLGARTSLANRAPGEQVTASDIFRPPWARTADSSVPSRYRIRTNWQVEPAAGDVFTRWKADELDGPIADIDSALAQAEPTPDTDSGRQLLGGVGAPTLLGYEIEQV